MDREAKMYVSRRYTYRIEGGNIMVYERQEGVPKFECTEYANKLKDYAVLIPIINEGDRIKRN